MGAIVGVLLAAGYAPEEMAEILTKETFSKVTGIAWQRTGLLKMEKLRPVLKKYLPEDNFSQLKKPFYVGLANLNEGTNVIRHRGALYDNIIASCSVPGIFAPVPIDDELYVDGGLLCNLPASAIRDKCRILIGSHVNFPGRKQRFLGPRSIVERAVNIGITQNAKAQMEQCDYLIDPPDMQYYSLVDFSKIKEIIETGYRHTMAMIASGELPLKKLQRASQKGNS
jgi:NTE family protein